MMKTIQTFLVLSAFRTGTAFVPVKPKSAMFRSIGLKYANNHDDRLPSLLRPFDLNGDGRLDMMDMKIFQSRIIQTSDLNGDGVLTFTDVFLALQIIALSWALTASPAAAKGGGHGGGGGGGGHGGGGAHSYSSSHSNSSPSIHQYSSSQPYQSSYDVAAHYRRSWFHRNWKYDKPWNPVACYDMPGEGEQIKVLISSRHRGVKYVPGLVTQSSEKDCTFAVQEERSPNDASLVKAPTIHSFQTIRNWNDSDLLFPLYFVTTLGGSSLGIALVSEAMAKFSDKSFDEEFLKSKVRILAQPLPVSGKYFGSTQESDGANQTVKVQLQFDAETREIGGSGYDSQDGKYHIKGEWAGDKVKWTERYQKESFSVDVRGRLNKDSTKLDCRFVSSRGVRGTFQLCQARGFCIAY